MDTQAKLRMATLSAILLLLVSGSLSASLANLFIAALVLSMPGAAAKILSARFLIYAVVCEILFGDLIEIEMDWDAMTTIMLFFALIELPFVYLFARSGSSLKFVTAFTVVWWSLFGCMSLYEVFPENIYNIGNILIPVVFLGLLCYENSNRDILPRNSSY